MSSDENTTPFECYEAEDSSGDNVTSLTAARQKRKPKASYADYLQLIQDVLGDTKRCIFTGDLCYFEPKLDRWVPVFHENSFGKIKSKAAETKGFFTISHIEHHIYRRTCDLDPELLVNIPEWDGVDRIAQVAECLHVTNISKPFAEELLKDYCGKIFSRIANPAVQNRILVMSGGQGLGKDYLVNAMFGALGQYLLPFTICQKEADTQAQLIAGALLVISEYDRTSRTDVSTLKNMITAPRAYFRAAYGRRAIDHAVRSSFIATCNLDGGILRDHTGNRRYIIFQLDKIDWHYPRNESPQFLAQSLALSREGFKASTSAEKALAVYLEEQTPENPEEPIFEDWERFMIAEMKTDPSGYAAKDLNTVWDKLRASHSRIPVNVLRSIIKRAGYYYRTENHRLYFANKTLVEEFKNERAKRTPAGWKKMLEGVSERLERDLSLPVSSDDEMPF